MLEVQPKSLGIINDAKPWWSCLFKPEVILRSRKAHYFVSSDDSDKGLDVNGQS